MGTSNSRIGGGGEKKAVKWQKEEGKRNAKEDTNPGIHITKSDTKKKKKPSFPKGTCVTLRNRHLEKIAVLKVKEANCQYYKLEYGNGTTYKDKNGNGVIEHKMFENTHFYNMALENDCGKLTWSKDDVAPRCQ